MYMEKFSRKPLRMSLCLFGESKPEIASLMGDHGFRELVRRLFIAEVSSIPPNQASLFERAVCSHLLAAVGEQEYQAGPRLIPIPASAEQDLPELIRPILAHYVEIAACVTAELYAAYKETTASERFVWNEASHSLVAGMFLDLSMGREVFRLGRIAPRAAGDPIVWAFEHVSAENAYGVQRTFADENGSAIAQLWHRAIPRDTLRLKSSHVSTLLRIAAGDQLDRGSADVLYLRHLKLLRSAGSSLQVQVPFFGPSDVEKLQAVLTSGAERLVNDAVVPALESIGSHDWWRDKLQHEGYRHAAVRLILEYGVDRVIASKVLEPFPGGQDLFYSWGRWIWQPATALPPEMPLS